MKILRGILFCILFCSPLVYAAQGTPDQSLSKELKGKTVLLRGMEAGNQLAFNAQGAALKTYETVSFSCSVMNIEKVHQSKTKLEIQGTRAVLIFDTNSQSPSIDDIRFIPVKAKVKITIAIDPADPDALKPAILKVPAFTVRDALAGEPKDQVDAKLATVGSLAPAVHYESIPMDTPTAAQVMTAGTYSVRAGVTPPRLIYSVGPIFPDSARKSNTGGISVLTLVVNMKGLPENMRIAKSAGHDLDAEAIAAVSQYRFSPAIYQGKPVAASVNVEVNFHVY